MKDIPFFTTDAGVVSLILKEMPYRREAYIRVRDVQPGKLDVLLSECVDFCRACGAEKIYAADHHELERYPIRVSVYEMRGTARVDLDIMENIFPVTEATVTQWREIYNKRMREVDCAATQTVADEKIILDTGGAYFVHHRGDLLGIGWLADMELRIICSVKRGAGERVIHTLMSLVDGMQIRLQVASTNQRAIRLYERLGFIKIKELQRWYRIL